MLYTHQLLFSDAHNYQHNYDVSLGGVLVGPCLTPSFRCPGQSYMVGILYFLPHMDGVLGMLFLRCQKVPNAGHLLV